MIKTAEKWDILPLLAAEFDSYKECHDAYLCWSIAYLARFPLHRELIYALKIRISTDENGQVKIMIGKIND